MGGTVNDKTDKHDDGDQTENPSDSGELIEELDKLGREIGRGLRKAWESDERKEIEAEVSKGIDVAGRELGKLAKEASESEAAKELRKGAKAVSRELRDGLMSGLRKLNEELDEEKK